MYLVTSASGLLEHHVTLTSTSLRCTFNRIFVDVCLPLLDRICITLKGTRLLLLRPFLPSLFPFFLSPLSVEEVHDNQLVCLTASANKTGGAVVRVLFGKAERSIRSMTFRYLDDPVITEASPAESFHA